jgi:hypothetical protein
MAVSVCAVALFSFICFVDLFHRCSLRVSKERVFKWGLTPRRTLRHDLTRKMAGVKNYQF